MLAGGLLYLTVGAREIQYLWVFGFHSPTEIFVWTTFKGSGTMECLGWHGEVYRSGIYGKYQGTYGWWRFVGTEFEKWLVLCVAVAYGV